MDVDWTPVVAGDEAEKKKQATPPTIQVITFTPESIRAANKQNRKIQEQNERK